MNIENKICLKSFICGDSNLLNYYVIDGVRQDGGFGFICADPKNKRLQIYSRDSEGVPRVINKELMYCYYYPKSFKAISGDVVLLEW